jgi:hypothetical protein
MTPKGASPDASRRFALPAPLNRRETQGLLLIAVAILGYLLLRYAGFIDWSLW